jgi:Tol biopolymer transport system component
MPLAAGTRLGPYEIIAPLGAGGMGEVYRARDTRLARDVAIKVLPQHLSSNPEVRARFEREAKTVSSLNHPNICTLFDVGREGDTDFLVMELVDGETLAQRITRGPLPAAEALRIGGQIADALDRAHRAGVIHRDLKPGNVMLTRSGAKLMDFGLARATGLAGAPSSGSGMATMTYSPTASAPLTAEGTIVGTFQYMAPEQLEGKETDARSDLWSLGCVLYEMVTGKRAFDGATQASLISAIMRDVPRPMTELAPMSPPTLERLVGALLAKDPDERIQTAHDVKLQLEWTGASSSGASAVATPRTMKGTPRGGTLAWGIAALAIIAAIVAFVRRPTPPAAIEFTLEPPAGYTFALPANPSLSPDGHTIACTVSDSSGQAAIAVRALDRAEMRVLAGTTGGLLPFWSPNGRMLGFFAQGKLMRMALDGSPPVPLADAPDARGGAWSKDGTIVYVPTAGGTVWRVPASGGTATQVTRFDAARGELGHRYPHLLRDGRRFLYIALDRDGKKYLCLGDLGGGPSHVLGEADNSATPVAGGWILTVERRRVVARRFDERSLRLAATSAEIGPCAGVMKIGHANLACDDRGTLVYQQELRQRASLRWYDATGQPISGVVGSLGTMTEMFPSPDQKKVAFVSAADGDLWLLDLDHPVPTRLTFFNTPQMGALNNLTWSPDSRRIAYALKSGTGHDVIHVVSTESGRDTSVFTAPGLFAIPRGWSLDGVLIAVCIDSAGNDLWTIPVDRAGTAAPYIKGPGDELIASFSPDGKWIASTVVVDGRGTMQILSWPHPGIRYQMTLDFDATTTFPFWCEGGRSLAFIDPRGRVLVVPIQLDGGFHQGATRVLFTVGALQVLTRIPPDLRRFLIADLEPLSNPAPLRVLTSWPARLRQ